MKQKSWFLYDKKSSDYKNGLLRQRVWAEIAKELGLDPKQTMKRWKDIRSKYVKLTKLPKSGSAGAGPSNAKHLWLIRALDFLKCHISFEYVILMFLNILF